MPPDRPEPVPLSLFEGDHLPRVRYERALNALDIPRAAADAPVEWRQAVARLAMAVYGSTPAKLDLDALVAARTEGWPANLERAWQRLVGQRLDGRGIPGVLEGEPAAAFLLRGGERERAERSATRHLQRHPADPLGWQVLGQLGDRQAAVRCAFHGGPMLPAVEPLVRRIEEDEEEDPAAWVLAHAWMGRWVGLPELRVAIAATEAPDTRPLPVQGDGRAFARYLIWAEETRIEGGGPSAKSVEDRRRMKVISPRAFERYLAGLG